MSTNSTTKVSIHLEDIVVLVGVPRFPIGCHAWLSCLQSRGCSSHKVLNFLQQMYEISCSGWRALTQTLQSLKSTGCKANAGSLVEAPICIGCNHLRR